MGPEIATNLETMRIAMERAVIPAIDPEDEFARENAHLVVMFLRMLADQNGYELAFRLQEIRELSMLIEDLRARAGEDMTSLGRNAEIDSLLEIAATYRALALPAYAEVAELARRLRCLASDIVENLGDRFGCGHLVRSGIADALVTQGASEARRDRAWVKAFGVDPTPDLVASISSVLSS